MKMKNLLSTTPPAVQYQAVPAFSYPLLPGQLICNINQMSSEVSLLICKICYCRNMFPGYYQEMGRGFGVNIPQDENPVILIEDIGWYITGQYVAENTFLFHL